MNFKSIHVGFGAFLQVIVSAVALAVLLASCGGGKNQGDTYTALPPASPVPVNGPDSFLLYPNPQSGPAIDTLTYAQAYYAAIDPNNDKDNLAKWKLANGFGTSRPGSEVQAVFGDVRDLGYGRYVTARKNTDDGTIAFYVDNYLVWTAAGYSYSNMNLDAAVSRDQRWYIGTNAIEVSPGPNGGPLFAKYYTFDPATGARLLAANLDGRGAKSMPGICIGCHGGRGDPLTYPDVSGKQLFPLVGSSSTNSRGDVKGKLHFFEPDTFSFSSINGYRRVDEELAIKTLNQWVLCTYPMPYSASGVARTNSEDVCRPQANYDEYEGAAAEVVKSAYGGNGLPNTTYSDNFVPASWVAGEETLYNNVVKPACRMCHILRGTAQESDDDFSTYAKFQSSADRIKAHILDHGNMPMTKVLYSKFWSTPDMYNTLNTFLTSVGTNLEGVSSPTSYTVLDSSGAPLKPGRPLADPGPDRVVPPTSGNQPAAVLSASGSLFADTYAWSITSMPPSGDGSLSSASGSTVSFNATVGGTYLIQLIASKGSVQSTPSTLTIVVNPAWPTTINPITGTTAINNPIPKNIRFSDIKAVLQEPPPTGGRTCIGCHVNINSAATMPPPIVYSDIDRNGDSVIQSGVSGTDDLWFYTEVLGRVNFSDIAGSILLRHPSGHHHFGGILGGFGIAASGIPADQLLPGDPKRSYYDMFVNWILNGAPY